MNLTCDSALWDFTLTSKWFLFDGSLLYFFGLLAFLTIFYLSSLAFSSGSESDSTAIVNFGLASLGWSLSSES